MKFNILNFDQQSLVNNDIDLKDSYILQWISDFYPNCEKTIIDDKEYAWICYSNLITQLPILQINTKDGLYRKLKKLCEKGFLEHATCYMKKGKRGNFSFFRITNKISILRSKYNSDEKSEGLGRKVGRDTDEKSEGIRTKSRNKDSSIIDSSINDSIPQTPKWDLGFIFDDSFKNLMIDFIEYRKSDIKKPFKSQKGVERAYNTLLELSNGEILTASQMVKRSMDNEWQGLFKIKSDNSNDRNISKAMRTILSTQL